MAYIQNLQKKIRILHKQMDKATIIADAMAYIMAYIQSLQKKIKKT